MASKELRPGSIRVRLAVLGSFGKWAVKHSRLEKSPMEVITLPVKKSRAPGVPLPEVARAIVNEYLAKERPGAAASEPLFLVEYRWYGGAKKIWRMSDQRIWKIIKDLGRRVGVDTIQPHAFRHACGVELLRRSGGNLRAVQEHLRHAGIQTTAIYTRLAPQDLQKVVNLFDENNGDGPR